MKKRLIINADDLGFSPGVNRGIFRACRECILTSATLAVNMPCAEEAAGESLAISGLGVGIHLNVVRGCPLLEKGKIPVVTGSALASHGTYWTEPRLPSSYTSKISPIFLGFQESGCDRLR